jgi:glycosyltransferase involved in cell wall biosynthesis
LYEDEFRVGVIGRLAPVKAPVLALDAVALLGWRARVVYVGDGPERKRILERSHQLGVPVSLVGLRPAAERLLKAFDVVACPSPKESFGLTMAQAAVVERPLAAVDSPGARFLVGELRDFLSLATPEAFATAIETATRASPESRSRLRSIIVERFSSERALERTRAFYVRRLMLPEQLDPRAS